MKTILITGATRGIGRATAEALAGPHTHLILTGRDSNALEDTDDLVQAKGGTATLIPHDLRNFPGIQEMARALESRETGLDALVLNGGMLGILQSLEDTPPKTFMEVLETNLMASFMFLQCFAAQLRQANGTVLALTTGAVSHPRGYWGAYAASKAGLESLIHTFAKEAGPNVTANLLDPGRVRTAMRAAAYPGEDPMDVRPAEDIAAVIRGILDDPSRPTDQRFEAAVLSPL